MKTKLYKLVQKYCIDNDISIKHIANEIGISQTYFSQMLHGKRKISETVLQRLANAMKVQSDVLTQHMQPDELNYTAK